MQSKLVPVDVIIAGVQKCGTTSLHKMLAQHPHIETHKSGQWPYFLHQEEYEEKYHKFMQNEFKTIDEGVLRLVRDTSVSTSKIACTRLKALSPNVRLILMLRDPIRRAYSGYTFAKSKQYAVAETFKAELSVEDRFKNDISTYLVRNHIPLSMYYKTIKRLEMHFNPDNIIIVRSEDLKSSPIPTCGRIFNFLKLDPFTVTPLIANVTRKARFPALQRLTKTDNIIRNWGKAIFPRSVISLALKVISKLNTSTKSFDDMPHEIEQHLQLILKDDMRKLKDEYQIDYC